MKIVDQNVELVDSMGSDLTVVNAARVSFHKESSEFTDKDAKLISYLARHNHWSPFAHTSLQFRIKAPIFVARQLVKHQVGGVWNEVSRRYVDDEPEFFLPGKGRWRHRPENAKQGSGDVGAKLAHPPGDYGRKLEDLWGSYDNEWDPDIHVSYAMQHCLDIYRQMIDGGVAPEQARMVLPQNMMTEWWWTGSLMFFARVCKLRMDTHAQFESGDIARRIDAAIPEKFQHSWKALTSEVPQAQS